MGLFNRRQKDAEASREEAIAALHEATEELSEVEARWDEVRAEGAWHRWRRDENHFVADLTLLMKGGAPS